MRAFPGSPTYEVTDVKLSQEKEDKLAAKLAKKIRTADNRRMSEMPKWRAWIEQANSRRKRKDAGSSGANVDPGLTGEYIQALKARLLNPIFQQDQVFVTIPRRPAHETSSRDIEKALDLICDKAPMMQSCDEWLDYALTLPFGVIKTHWVNESRFYRKWTEMAPEEVFVASGGTKTVSQGNKKFKEEEVEVIERQGAYPEVIPSEDFFFPDSAYDVKHAEWVAHRFFLCEEDVKARINRGYYREKIGGDPTLDVLGEPSGERKPLMKPQMTDEDDFDKEKQYELYEVYTTYDFGSGEEEEIIGILDLESEKFLSLIYNPYHSFPRPFVTWAYKKVHGSIAGQPMTYVLEPIHVAYMASICQRLDAASKANEILILCRTGSDLKKIFENGLRGGVYDIADDPNDIKEFKLSQPFTQLPELEGILRAHADKRIGYNDYLRGNEMIDRPTASGQLSLIEEGKQQFFILLESFRAALAEVAMHMMSRYKQFFPAGLELYVQSAGPGENPLQLVQWPDAAIEEAIMIETKVSSATMSKMIRKQEVLALVDKIPQMYQTLMGIAQQAISPTPMAPVAAQLLMGFQVALDKFFTEFEISKKEYLNPNLQGALQHGQQMAQLMQQMQQMAQENMALKQQMGMGGQPPGGGVSGSPGGQPGLPQPPNMGGPPAG